MKITAAVIKALAPSLAIDRAQAIANAVNDG